MRCEGKREAHQEGRETKLDGFILGRLETTLASAQRLSAYAQIGRLLREFYRISMEAFGYIGPKGIWTAHPAAAARRCTHQAAIAFSSRSKR